MISLICLGSTYVELETTKRWKAIPKSSSPVWQNQILMAEISRELNTSPGSMLYISSHNYSNIPSEDKLTANYRLVTCMGRPTLLSQMEKAFKHLEVDQKPWFGSRPIEYAIAPRDYMPSVDYQTHNGLHPSLTRLLTLEAKGKRNLEWAFNLRTKVGGELWGVIYTRSRAMQDQSLAEYYLSVQFPGDCSIEELTFTVKAIEKSLQFSVAEDDSWLRSWSKLVLVLPKQPLWRRWWMRLF